MRAIRVRVAGMQVGCAMVSHAVTSLVWSQSLRGRELAGGVVAALHCGHPDAELDAVVSAGLQFFGVVTLGMVALRFGTVVVDLFEMIGQLIINALIVAGGNHM